MPVYWKKLPSLTGFYTYWWSFYTEKFYDVCLCWVVSPVDDCELPADPVSSGTNRRLSFTISLVDHLCPASRSWWVTIVLGHLNVSSQTPWSLDLQWFEGQNGSHTSFCVCATEGQVNRKIIQRRLFYQLASSMKHALINLASTLYYVEG